MEMYSYFDICGGYMTNERSTIMNLIDRNKYQKIVLKYLERLYAKGLKQYQIAKQLKIDERTVRKWEYFRSVPSGVQYLNLKNLCKKLGA